MATARGERGGEVSMMTVPVVSYGTYRDPFRCIQRCGLSSFHFIDRAQAPLPSIKSTPFRSTTLRDAAMGMETAPFIASCVCWRC